MTLVQLKRVRWLVRLALALGVAASVTANILHAERNPISEAIAAWPPLALLLTIELVSRVPVHRRALAWVRRGGTASIAGIAAWVSYWHMAGVALRYGESFGSAHLEPLSVDGLVVVASVSLVELAGRIRAVTETTAPVPDEPLVAAEEPVEQPAVSDPPKPDTPAIPSRPPARRSGRPSAAKKVAKAAAKMPDASVDKIAAKTKVSERTVRRHLAAMTVPAETPATETKDGANGVAVPELLRTTD